MAASTCNEAAMTRSEMCWCSQRICHRSSEVALPERFRRRFTSDPTPTSCAVVSENACSESRRSRVSPAATNEIVTNVKTGRLREKLMETMITQRLLRWWIEFRAPERGLVFQNNADFFLP